MDTNNLSPPLAIARRPLLGCATFSAGPFQDISEGFPRFFEALLAAVSLDNAHHESATHFDSSNTPISASPTREPAFEPVNSPELPAFPVNNATPDPVVIEVDKHIAAIDEAAISPASTSDCVKLSDDPVTAECILPAEDTSIPDIAESLIDHVSTSETSILSPGIATSLDPLAEHVSHLADLTPDEEPAPAELPLASVEAFTVDEVRDFVTDTALAAEVAELVTAPCSEDTSSAIQASIATEETTSSEISTTSMEDPAITVTEPIDSIGSETFTTAESTESVPNTTATESAESVAITTAIEPITVAVPEPVIIVALEPVTVPATESELVTATATESEPVITTAPAPEPLLATASESTTATSEPITISATSSIELVATTATEPVPESTSTAAEPTSTANDLAVIETSPESLLEHSAATEELMQPTSSEDSSPITEPVTVIEETACGVNSVAAEPTVAIDNISGNPVEPPLNTLAPITILSAEDTPAILTTQEAETAESGDTNELPTEPTQDPATSDLVVAREPLLENIAESDLENHLQYDSELESSWEVVTSDESTFDHNNETAPVATPLLVTAYPLIFEDDFDAAASSIFNTELERLFDTDITWSIPQVVEKGKSERDTVRERLTKKTTTRFNLQNLRLEKAAQALSVNGAAPINTETHPVPALEATRALPIVAQQAEVPADVEGNTITSEVFSDNEEAVVDVAKDISTGGHSRTGSSSSDESKLSAGAVFDSAPCPGTPVTEYCMTPPKSHADEVEKANAEPTADMKATDAVGSTNGPEEAAANGLSQDEDETTK
ncbi:hypothetical protein NEMBOFW57_003719 [Staphylotrichum longicolle]|uniref:Uncharacterized protein n=1 Tax=Staphylotrichum longicolle TaxID=669026 RepID=A0AAD4F6L1_9PEZI|nr:hypothetical protein NEMBOFW57_003719 [Staphylotrichum longicolle]